MTDNTDIGTTDIEEEIKDTPILKPKKKREMTEKQKASLESGRQKRKEKLNEKKESLKMEYAKKLYEEEQSKKQQQEKPITQKQKVKPPPPPQEESSSSEEEEVIIKSKPSKKKKKKIVIELSSSDDDSDTDVKATTKPTRSMITQQNKKSIIKVTEPSKKNYFAD